MSQFHSHPSSLVISRRCRTPQNRRAVSWTGMKIETVSLQKGIVVLGNRDVEREIMLTEQLITIRQCEGRRGSGGWSSHWVYPFRSAPCQWQMHCFPSVIIYGDRWPLSRSGQTEQGSYSHQQWKPCAAISSSGPRTPCQKSAARLI